MAMAAMRRQGNYLRVRGEYCLPPYLRNFCRELPPRARRIPGWAIGLDKLPGTTSACAENTGEISWPHHGSRNYLRVRGEYSISHTQISYDLELPPRARRILPSPLFNEFPHGTTSACAENTRGTVFCQVDGGTTSACAENTHPATHNNALSRNYLRVRGEYALDYLHGLLRTELPPRARRIRGFPAPRYQR